MYGSSTEAFIEQQMRREIASRNSVVGIMVEEQIRRMSDPMYQMMQRASERAALRAKERRFWFYRKTTGIINKDKIRKAVNKLLERLFSKKVDPTSFVNRVRAALSVHDNCDCIVKAHSPPIRLIPKTLHPVDSVA